MGEFVHPLVRVAKAQRGLLWCILAQLLIMVGMFGLGPQATWLGLFQIVVSIAGAIFALRLAWRVFGRTGAIICTILLFSPLAMYVLAYLNRGDRAAFNATAAAAGISMYVSLGVLLVVNRKAIKALRAVGARVGLMGANVADVARRATHADAFD